MYTKGEWGVDGFRITDRDGRDIAVACLRYDGEGENIENVLSAETEANAHLIVAAVNACASVNPDNPQAVAESIKDMYEALRTICEAIRAGEIARAGRVVNTNGIIALSKADGGK